MAPARWAGGSRSSRCDRVAAAARLTKQFDGAGELEALAWARHHRTVFAGGSFSDAGYRQADSGAGAELHYSQLVFGRHGVSALLAGSGDWLEAPGAHPS